MTKSLDLDEIVLKPARWQFDNYIKAKAAIEAYVNERVVAADMNGRLKAYKVVLRRRIAHKSMDTNYFKDLVRQYEYRIKQLTKAKGGGNVYTAPDLPRNEKGEVAGGYPGGDGLSVWGVGGRGHGRGGGGGGGGLAKEDK